MPFSPTVLCIDDNTTALRVRRLLLESRGYRVLTAASGPEGIKVFEAESVDIVVLDYYMPGMLGDAVAEVLKQQKPAIPIVLLSAYLDLPSEVLTHIDQYVCKGQSPALLLSKVADLLAAGSRLA